MLTIAFVARANELNQAWPAMCLSRTKQVAFGQLLCAQPGTLTFATHASRAHCCSVDRANLANMRNIFEYVPIVHSQRN